MFLCHCLDIYFLVTCAQEGQFMASSTQDHVWLVLCVGHLQELTMTFLTRLSHWPVSLAFGQWLDYTHRQRQLRQLAQEVEENHRALTVTLAFRLWRSHQANNQKATNMSVGLSLFAQGSLWCTVETLMGDKPLFKTTFLKRFPRYFHVSKLSLKPGISMSVNFFWSLSLGIFMSVNSFWSLSFGITMSVTLSRSLSLGISV